MDVELVLDITVYALLGITALSMIRVVIGPSAEDRMIALNLVASQVLAVLVLLSVKESRAIYLDVALIYAILGYIGILAIAKYLEKGEEQ